MGKPEAQRREGTCPKATASHEQSQICIQNKLGTIIFHSFPGQKPEPEAKELKIIVCSILQACVSALHVGGAKLV